MRPRLKPTAFTTLFGASAAALAIGLGDPALESTIGQPLRARIPLLLQPGETASPGCISVVPGGGEYALPGAQAELARGGREVVVTTRDPVNAPAASFSLRADCAGQRASRNYTLLPDPAVEKAPASAAAPRPAMVAGAGPGTSWELRPGESVQGIAGAIFPGAPGLQRRLVAAIVAASPAAFPEGNPDRPAAGAVIVIPDLRTLGITARDLKPARPPRAKMPPRAAPAPPDEITLPDLPILPMAEYSSLLQRIAGLERVLAGMKRAVLEMPSPAAGPKPAPAAPAAPAPQPAETGGAGLLAAAAAALLALGAGGFLVYSKRRAAAAPEPAPVEAAPEPPPVSGVEAALQEAQLSVAAGYPQRAFELLEQHIRANPEETRTWMLMFAILRSQHMSTEYLELALRFAATRPAPALWQEVQRMGRELDPEGQLYREEGAPSPVTPGPGPATA